MTAPVDHRPYAGPTDLVTAEDVARWLDERAMASPPEPVPQYSRHWILELAWADLHARLDRERRQACRRGCFAEAHEAYMWRAAERESCRGETWAAVYRERRACALRRALAFRAAARQP